MDRRPTTQDISWLLDLHKNKQLDLSPPYQRRSVWTPKDRRFFIDTIFRNFPSPAIFLHKHITLDGNIKYHVVDGKQRLETILSFSGGKIRIGQDFGDDRLNGKRWNEISNDIELKMMFWNYQVPVEMIDFRDASIVNNVFDRLNRNSRRLTNQELRHAKFDGWFIQTAEREAELSIWRDVGVSTRARSNRMIDVQFISELMAVVLKSDVQGFSQEHLDEIYAEYDEPYDLEGFDEGKFVERIENTRRILSEMESHNNCITAHAHGVGPLYTLWTVLALNNDLPPSNILAERYDKFMQNVEKLNLDPLATDFAQPGDLEHATRYRENARGASTDLNQRKERYTVLQHVLMKQ